MKDITLEEVQALLNDIALLEKAIHNYSTWYVDWDRLYNNPSYKPEFPVDILNSSDALKRMKGIVDKLKNIAEF